MIKTSFHIPKELHQKFKETCVGLGVYMNDILKEIINEWLMKQEAIKE